MCCCALFPSRLAGGGGGKLVSISITEMPEKTCYYAGDIFDKSGMKVVANYADGTTKEVYDYTVNKTALEIADKTIVVSYLEKTAIVNVTVVKSDREAPTQINYTFEGNTLVIDVQDGVEYNFDKRGWSVFSRYENLTEGKSYSLSARYYETAVTNASAINTVTVSFGNDGATTPTGDYNYFRNKYDSLAEETEINLLTATYDEVMNMLSTQGKYLIYFGGAWDGLTQQKIKDLNDTAKRYDAIVYNLDLRLTGTENDDPRYDLSSDMPNVLKDALLAKLNNQQIDDCSYIELTTDVSFDKIPQATLLAVEVDSVGNVTVLAIGDDKETFDSTVNIFARQ